MIENAQPPTSVFHFYSLCNIDYSKHMPILVKTKCTNLAKQTICQKQHQLHVAMHLNTLVLPPSTSHTTLQINTNKQNKNTPPQLHYPLHPTPSHTKSQKVKKVTLTLNCPLQKSFVITQACKILKDVKHPLRNTAPIMLFSCNQQLKCEKVLAPNLQLYFHL